MKQVKQSKIVFMGYCIVNIPITIIILLVTFVLAKFSSLSFGIAMILASAAGWMYWEFAVAKWIKWSLIKGIDKKVLHKLGVQWLLLWKRDLARIETIQEQLQANPNS